MTTPGSPAPHTCSPYAPIGKGADLNRVISHIEVLDLLGRRPVLYERIGLRLLAVAVGIALAVRSACTLRAALAILSTLAVRVVATHQLQVLSLSMDRA